MDANAFSCVVGRLLASLLCLSIACVAPPARAFTPIGPNEECFELVGADPSRPSGVLKLGRVIGDAPAQFQIFLPSVCHASCAGMPRAYAYPGNLVAVGQASSGFVCAHYADGSPQNESHGWLPARQVRVEDPKRVAVPLAAWNGVWHAMQQAATITLSSDNGGLDLVGDAVYPNSNEPRAVGHIEAHARPIGSTVIFTTEDCQVSLLMVGHLLAVTDNEFCGGMNVRFADFYRLAPP